GRRSPGPRERFAALRRGRVFPLSSRRFARSLASDWRRELHCNRAGENERAADRADSAQTLAEQDRARKRGEDALQRENERGLGRRRVRLGEDLDRISQRARDDSGEQDRRRGGDQRARRHRFEHRRAQRREAGANRVLHEREQERPARAGKEDRRQRDARRPGEIGEKHERVALVGGSKPAAGGQKPGAGERYEARRDDDRARTRATQRPGQEGGQHDIAGGQEAGVGGARRLDPRLLQARAKEEGEADHEREAPFVAGRRMRLPAEFPQRERRKRHSRHGEARSDEGERRHGRSGVFLRDEGYAPQEGGG